jgi:folate-binding protein YgfZ
MTASDPLPRARLAAFVCPLPHLGSLRFEGADAASFLHGQVSSDVRELAPGRVQRSSYSSPKGRVLADLWLWRAPQDDATIHALLAVDLAPAIAKRLAMFVLRSKVRVSDVTAAAVRLGVAGADAAAALERALGARPEPGAVVITGGVAVLGWPDGRFVVEAQAADTKRVQDALATHAAPTDTASWIAADVRAGVPLVTAATSDQFVPQALNLDVLGAVNFQKGCYPGQEIVARTQYLGRLKERLYAFQADVPPPAIGTRLYAASFGDQPCGTIVSAAAVAGTAHSQMLGVAQRAAVEDDSVHLGARDGPLLASLALPYAVPGPTAPRGRLA